MVGVDGTAPSPSESKSDGLLLSETPIKISSNQFSKINISFKRCEYYTKNTHGCQNYRQYFQEKYPKICWFSSWVFNIEILVVVKIISFFSNV
jgi:hypothetical protein